MRTGVAVSDVTKGTGALVRAGHCAQPGDNTVDRSRQSVGTAEPTLNYLWSAVATMSRVPMTSNFAEPLSTIGAQPRQWSDLRKRTMSTESTGLMTTSLRYGSDMTQDVRRFATTRTSATRLSTSPGSSLSDSQ